MIVHFGAQAQTVRVDKRAQLHEHVRNDRAVLAHVVFGFAVHEFFSDGVDLLHREILAAACDIGRRRVYRSLSRSVRRWRFLRCRRFPSCLRRTAG